jgi:hypothetical protein
VGEHRPAGLFRYRQAFLTLFQQARQSSRDKHTHTHTHTHLGDGGGCRRDVVPRQPQRQPPLALPHLLYMLVSTMGDKVDLSEREREVFVCVCVCVHERMSDSRPLRV